jgi:hypothetical protein
MDPNGIQKAVVGKACWFGRFVYYSLNNSMIRPIGGIFMHLGFRIGWMYSNIHLW